MGFFILWKNSGGFVGNQIEKHQLKMGFNKIDSKYTHIDVSGGGPFVVCVSPPKTVVLNIEERYAGGSEFIVVRYKDATYQARKRYKVAFWAASNCNTRYDWFGVFKFILKKWIFHKKDWFFCSENALWALKKEHPEALGSLLPYECMPAHFLDKAVFEIVYQDKLPG